MKDTLVQCNFPAPRSINVNKGRTTFEYTPLLDITFALFRNVVYLLDCVILLLNKDAHLKKEKEVQQIWRS